MTHRSRQILLAAFAITAFCLAGCTTSPHQTWQSLKGEGFSGWNEQLGSGIRASNNAQPSGHFTDKRSEQIEQDLGGF